MRRMSRNQIAREFRTTASRLIYGESTGLLPVWGKVTEGQYRAAVLLWLTARRKMTTQEIRRVLTERRMECRPHLTVTLEVAS